MATKTFKIGLSNTDKQNMAQEVYERLLALTFPEYDTAESYEVGDFVVYNDQLYKCIGATTGAWDSTKWQLATLNDLLTDIEDAVAFVNDKANVDGNYPTMTVGVADQLSPYDEESGDDQDEPFSFQATGTGNGSQPDFSTGAIALMKEKRGNTVVVNQLINPNNLPATTTNNGVTFTNNGDGTITVDGTATGGDAEISVSDVFNNVRGHKVISIGNTDSVKVYDGYNYSSITGYVSLFTVHQNASSLYILVANGDTVNNVTIKPMLIDLTQWFNGDIPQDLLDHPENFFRYYQGSLAYNEGTLVNSNGRYLKTIGRNQWDEEYVNGYYDENDANATFYSYTNYIASKNPIKVIPNTDYYIKSSPVSGAAYILYFDKDGNYLGNYSYLNDGTFTTPANCCSIKFYFNNGSNVYSNNVTISIYYEDESGYDQYYPYEVLTNNDTGTETLRSAGSVADIKLPNGEIKRNVGIVDLSTLSWSAGGTGASGKYRWVSYSLAQLIKSTGVNVKANILCSKYDTKTANEVYQCVRGISLDDTTISIYDEQYDDGVSFTASGYLFYELATPTEEQGTPYSENLFIDDFGSMDFSGTSGVPQGNLIFYPVDYKAFIDTLYDYTEGTPSNIALKSDLSADKSELQGVDTQLLNAIGGTLRQCLCVKETLDFNNTAFLDLGTLTWTQYASGSIAWSTSAISGLKHSTDNDVPTKMICSLLKTSARNSQPVDTISTDNDGAIWIRKSGSGSMTADQFKNSLKLVLLAYEKESA